MSELHFLSVGEGPPLVFVHGLAGSTRWWRRNVQPLSRHFKVYVLDLPGFGRSNAPCPLEEIAASLPAWLDQMGLERVRLVGHSMGGYISLRLAATQPERVAQLALIDSVGMPLHATLPHLIGRTLLGARYSSLTFVPTILWDGLRAGIPTLLRLASEIMDVDARPLLQALQMPTLILWGTRDVLLPPHLGSEMAELVPDATLHLIPRAGHNAMADRPALVNRHLLDFFSREGEAGGRNEQTEN